MFTGALILNIFAAVWWGFGLSALAVSRWLFLAPILVSAALTAGAWSASRHVPPRTPEDEKRVGRLITIWSVVEGTAFFIGINVLINLRRQRDIAPALAMIVGAHFLPLARGLPLRIYYATGLSLLAIGAAALAMPAPLRQPVAAIAAGAILWVTSATISVGAMATGRQQE